MEIRTTTIKNKQPRKTTAMIETKKTQKTLHSKIVKLNY